MDHPFEVIEVQLYEFINKYLFDLEGLYRRSKGLTVTGKDGTPVLAFFAPPKSSPPFPILELSKGGDTIQDKYPVTHGHLLVLPRRHTPDLFGMVEREWIDANNLLRILKTRIQREDLSVTGFNVGMNCGEDAGQTVMHAHIHLIPRRRGDTAKPQGGVRGVIPESMSTESAHSS